MTRGDMVFNILADWQEDIETHKHCILSWKTQTAKTEKERDELYEKLSKIKAVADKQTELGSEAMVSLSEIRQLVEDWREK